MCTDPADGIEERWEGYLAPIEVAHVLDVLRGLFPTVACFSPSHRKACGMYLSLTMRSASIGIHASYSGIALRRPESHKTDEPSQ